MNGKNWVSQERIQDSGIRPRCYPIVPGHSCPVIQEIFNLLTEGRRTRWI